MVVTLLITFYTCDNTGHTRWHGNRTQGVAPYPTRIQLDPVGGLCSLLFDGYRLQPIAFQYSNWSAELAHQVHDTVLLTGQPVVECPSHLQR